MKQETKCYCGHTTYCDCGPLEEPKQETAVEWLISILNKEGFAPVLNDDEIQKAKEMEKEQAERMYSDLYILRNDLYNKLPTSNVDTFELLKIIKNHIQKLDDLCGNK
jgi:hypothetical protein